MDAHQIKKTEPKQLSLAEKAFQAIVGSLFWIRIFVSPLLAGIMIGGLVFLAIQGFWGWLAWGVLALIGMVSGVLLAEHARRTRGTVEFMSRVGATPELDRKEEQDPERTLEQGGV